MAESGLLSKIVERIHIGADIKEPVITGSEYIGTKKVLQSYAEQRKWLKTRLNESKRELERCRSTAKRAEIVGEGRQIEGYGLLFPLSDDYDLVAELRAAAESFRRTHGLGNYNRRTDRHGRLVFDGTEIDGYSLLFPSFLDYDAAKELDGMADAFTAAYGVQLYAGAIDSVDSQMYYEDNAAQIRGNKELADRIKESDTTLLLSLTSSASDGARERDELPEVDQDEIERALQEMVAREAEIQTPSRIAPEYQMPQAPIAPTIGVATLPSGRRRIRDGEMRVKRARAKT